VKKFGVKNKMAARLIETKEVAYNNGHADGWTERDNELKQEYDFNWVWRIFYLLLGAWYGSIAAFRGMSPGDTLFGLLFVTAFGLLLILIGLLLKI
jgi:hypothetical protein